MAIIFSGSYGIAGKFAIYRNATPPVWVTAGGSLGTMYENVTISPITLVASPDETIVYAIASGVLPNGITLSPTGVLSGTAGPVTADTTFTFAVSATNSANAVAYRTFSLTVLNNANAPEWVTPSGNLGTFKLNDVIAIQLVTSDPNGNIDHYTITSGALPDGVVINQYSGLLTGTVSETVAGDYTFAVTVTDTTMNSVTREFTLTIANAAIMWITPAGALQSVDIGAEVPSLLEAISI